MLPLTDMRKKSIWFLGFHDELFTPIAMYAFLSFQYCVWEAKLKKTIPSFNTLFLSFSDNFSLTYKHNASVRKSSLKNNFSLCRVLLGDRQAAQDGRE
jgi:predicted membrane metal-binding protein